MTSKEKYSTFTKKDLFHMIMNHVVKSEKETEESIDIPEKDEEMSTHLKIIFLKDDSNLLTPFNLFDRLLEISSFNRWVQNLISKWAFIGYKTAEKDLYVLEAIERAYDRPAKFFFILEDGFWLLYTLEDHRTMKQTIERIVKYIPELNMLWFPPPDLELIVNKIFTESGFGGFTAKYRPLLRDKNVTIRIFGGDRDDLLLARKDFQAEPTKIWFHSRGSPLTVTAGSLSPGRLDIKSVLSGYEEQVQAIIKSVKDDIFERESQNFGLINGYERRIFTDEDGNVISQAPSVFSAVVLTVDEAMRQKKDITTDKLIERLKAAFLNYDKHYAGYEWDYGNLEVVDLTTGEPFQVIFENWQFIIYPKEETHAATVREACKQITQNIIPSCVLSVMSEELA
ncbi:MAG: hypothetical protein HXS54_05235 [Theionarchaea archaeon]|nr:hypothetical protein [Theionarchaea archaeon]